MVPGGNAGSPPIDGAASLNRGADGTDVGCGGCSNDFDGVSCGMLPVSSGGKLPEGKDGVTNRPPEATGACGAASGAAGSPDEADVIEGNDPALPFPAEGATQPTAPPPLVPEQLQVHGPCPLTALEIPAAHKPLRGAVKVGTPFAPPQAPVIGGGGCSGAVQLTDMPPLVPRQFQFHGP